MKAALAPLLLLTVSASISAAEPDPRFSDILYTPGQTVSLNSSVGGSLSVVFAAEEHVVHFEAADPAAFNIATSGNGDSVVIQMLRLPVRPELTVRTQLRDYNFMIQNVTPAQATYVARFSYSAFPGNARATYKLSGEKALLPSRISDDGVHTYLEWPEDEALPAVFAVNSIGEEEMVDGYMRGGIFTIDRVNNQLMFRIGKKKAKAVRNGK